MDSNKVEMEVKKKKWGEEIMNNVCSIFSICASWEASLIFSFIHHLLDVEGEEDSLQHSILCWATKFDQ